MKRKSLAIPLRVTDFSDTSQIVTLFTREAGLVDAIAKGAHRKKSPFQGPFDLAVLREVVYVERRLPGLAIVAESEVIDGYRGLRRSWNRYVSACHVIDFIRAVATGGESATTLFDLGESTLGGLAECAGSELSTRVLHFELRALRILGFLAAIDACVACTRPWPGGARPAYFSPRNGGLLCRECRNRSRDGPAVALPGGVVKTLQVMAEGSLMERNVLDRPVLAELHELLFDGCVFFLDRPFRMLKYSPAWL